MQQNTKPVSIPIIDPRKGWNRFLKGLAVFAVGLLIIVFTNSAQKEVLYFGVAIMGGGFTYALTGYIPMFIHRMTSVKRTANHNREKR